MALIDAVLLRTYAAKSAGRGQTDTSSSWPARHGQRARTVNETGKKLSKWETLAGWDTTDISHDGDVIIRWMATRQEKPAPDDLRRLCRRAMQNRPTQRCPKIEDYDTFVSNSLGEVLRPTFTVDKLACDANSNPTNIDVSKPIGTVPSGKEWVPTPPAMTSSAPLKLRLRRSHSALSCLRHDGASRDHPMTSDSRAGVVRKSTDERSRRGTSALRVRHDVIGSESAAAVDGSRTAAENGAVRGGVTSDVRDDRRLTSDVTPYVTYDPAVRRASSAHGVLRLSRQVLNPRVGLASVGPATGNLATGNLASGNPATGNPATGNPATGGPAPGERPSPAAPRPTEDPPAPEPGDTDWAGTPRGYVHPVTLVLKTVSVQEEGPTRVDSAVPLRRTPPGDEGREGSAEEREAGSEGSGAEALLDRLAIPLRCGLAAMREGMRLLRLKEQAKTSAGPAGFRPTKLKTTLQTVRAHALHTRAKCSKVGCRTPLQSASSANNASHNVQLENISDLLNLTSSSDRLSRRRAIGQMNHGIYCGTQSRKSIKSRNASIYTR